MSNQIRKEYLSEVKSRVEENSFHPNEFKELFELKRDIVTASILNRREAAEAYQKFRERVKDEPYFRLHHIDELEMPYDILIFVSEKNIGKSRQMLWHMNDAYERGKKFVIMRALDVHISNGLFEQLCSQHSNFYLSNAGRINRKDTEKYQGHAGYAMSLNTCTKWKGGDFDDVEFIWFDEATDEHKDITVDSFRRFFISMVNSVERRKEDFRVIIMGNTDFSVSHPLFEYFEIDPAQNLVYTTRRAPGAERDTRILYINSRGLYGQGAKGSRFIGAGGDPKAALDAFMNTVKNNTDRLTALDLTYLAEPLFCLVFKDAEGAEWQLVVAKHVFKEYADGQNIIVDKETTWYYLKIDPFKPEYLYGYTIYTDDVTMHSLYRGFVHYKKSLKGLWKKVWTIIRMGRAMFIKTETKKILYRILERECGTQDKILG